MQELARLVITLLVYIGGLGGGAPPRVTLPPVVREAPAWHVTAEPDATAAATLVWLKRVNQYRALAGLKPVSASPIWSNGARLHARYMAKNDTVTHDEDPANEWYTKAGQTAARASNVMASFDVSTPDTFAIDYWMQGPFHAVGILHPNLARTGFGSFREAGGFYGMAAALDVIRGRNYQLPVTYPVTFPSGATPTPQRAYIGGEHPNPLTSCPGYSAPSGPAIMLMLGNGSVTPRVTAHSLKLNGASIAHCIFDETNYKNPDANDQLTGRASLGQADMIVIMPRQRLVRGRTYTVSVKANGKNLHLGLHGRRERAVANRSARSWRASTVIGRRCGGRSLGAGIPAGRSCVCYGERVALTAVHLSSPMVASESPRLLPAASKKEPAWTATRRRRMRHAHPRRRYPLWAPRRRARHRRHHSAPCARLRAPGRTDAAVEAGPG